MRVVWDGEALHLEVSEFELGAGLEEHPIRFVLELGLNSLGCKWVGEDFWPVLLGKSRDAGDVVAMLVSDKNRIDFLRFDVSLFEHAAKSLAAEASIDEDLAIFREQQAGIAGARAS